MLNPVVTVMLHFRDFQTRLRQVNQLTQKKYFYFLPADRLGIGFSIGLWNENLRIRGGVKRPSDQNELLTGLISAKSCFCMGRVSQLNAPPEYKESVRIIW